MPQVSEEQPWQPEEDGFEFSSAQLAAWISRRRLTQQADDFENWGKVPASGGALSPASPQLILFMTAGSECSPEIKAPKFKISRAVTARFRRIVLTNRA